MTTPTITGNKLTWRWTSAGTEYEAALTGVPVVTVPPVDPPPPPPPAPTGDGIWISRAEIMALPMTGAAWDAVLAAANQNVTTSALGDQDSPNNVVTLAKALVFVRKGEAKYRDETLTVLRHLINTGASGRTLALGRELAAYVVAADLVGLDQPMRAAFESQLRALRTKPLEGRTLISTHEDRANNWGTHAGASRAAVAAYLGDRADLDRCAFVFRGWLGDLSAYRGFKFGDPGWQADKANPVGINRVGATISGHSVDGALPEEMRRGGAFKWPPPYQNYVGGGMSGVVAQAWFLHRAGYPAFEWADRAILRAVKFWHDNGHKFTGDDAWLVAVTNKIYGRTDPVETVAPGKGMGWTQWTHQ